LWVAVRLRRIASAMTLDRFMTQAETSFVENEQRR
jgi:hypothetical protein